MLKRLSCWFSNFTKGRYGVGYFDIPKYQVPPLKVDRSFKAKQIQKIGNNNYGKNRVTARQPQARRTLKKTH